ncbi:hypothetical protein GCM10010254_40770 [Streptomyces chromofuscus]|nr:hypothetical protein GCM10010254_40770 [Streptomyces chromofuscus]
MTALRGRAFPAAVGGMGGARRGVGAIPDPATPHDPTPFGCSHAVAAPGEPVFRGGQYASDPGTEAPVPGDVAARVELPLTHPRSVPEGVGLGFEHMVRLRPYDVDHDLAKPGILGTALHEAFGEPLPAQTPSGVAALALPGMLFEIDAVAPYAPPSTAPSSGPRAHAGRAGGSVPGSAEAGAAHGAVMEAEPAPPAPLTSPGPAAADRQGHSFSRASKAWLTASAGNSRRTVERSGETTTYRRARWERSPQGSRS